MKCELLYSRFLEEIASKIPQRTEVVTILSDILCIGKEAVYRRLRGEVPFTFYEVMTISRYLDISLDNLDLNIDSKSKPFRLKQIEYINPVETDFALMDEMTAIMKSFQEDSNPEAGEITNMLPQPLYVNQPNVFKFYLFKWRYQSHRRNKIVPYKDIVIVDKLQKSQEEYVTYAKGLPANYVLDYQLFYYLVTNIKYFHTIGLITREEVKLIKQDLLKILDEIDYLTAVGSFRETGEKVNIYITHVNVDTNYIYVSAHDFQLTIIKAFLLNGIASTDKSTFDEVKRWMHSMKLQSTLITGSGERERISFLEEQHRLVESLSSL